MASVAPIADEPAHDGIAQRLLDERRLRDATFDPLLFGNPAWDLLLTLYRSSNDPQPPTSLAMCELMPVPQSVSLRWLTYMAAEGMVIEISDPSRRGEPFLRLSAQTRRDIAIYLSALQERRAERQQAG